LLAAVNEAYRYAVDLASYDTGLPQATFPEICPYSVEQLLKTDFWPGAQTE
jgi:hypothetical protein